MLWLCIRLPRLAQEARPGAAAADRSSLPTAPPEVAAHEAMERLAAWAYQWTSLLSYRLPPLDGPHVARCARASGAGDVCAWADEALLWLELGASRTLLGSPEVLIERIDAGLEALGYTHGSAFAPSPTGAAVLSRVAPLRVAPLAGGDRDRVSQPPPAAGNALTAAQLRERLEPLPLALLELPSSTLTALHTAGLRRIGELLELPAAAVARRFGPAVPRYLRRLCALAPDPRAAWQAPEHYRGRCELGAPVRDSTALLFALQRLLLEFQGYLRARDAAVAAFTLDLEHPHGAASRLRIGLSQPGRDAAQLLLLARERLGATVLPAPVEALQLQAPELCAPSVMQTDLFGRDEQRLRQLHALLDRLRARLGASSVQQLQLLADHRPERAARADAPERCRAGASGTPARSLPAASRPAWLLTEPQPLVCRLELLGGPERIESGWWDGSDVVRDYYRARAPDGAQLWVFRDLRDRRWYLQGLWA